MKALSLQFSRQKHPVLITSIVCLAALLVVLSGLIVRRALWEPTDRIRFPYDVGNSFAWGSRVLDEAGRESRMNPSLGAPTGWRPLWRGFVGIYDKVAAEHPDGNYKLDYPPLRLLVSSVWVRHERRLGRHEAAWPRDYGYTAPLLRSNTVAEFLAAVLAFLIVQLWLRRNGAGIERAAFLGAFVAALLWVNPAVLINAHVWPQWDVWLLPLFLGAVMAASFDRWFAAGVCIAVGGLFKGQMLLIAPVFVFWPLFQGRIAAAGRLVLGFALAVALVAAPWLVRGTYALIWVGAVLLVGAVVGISRGFERPTIAYWLAGLLAAAIFAAAWAFGGSFNWFRIGTAYGTRHFMAMVMGPTANVPGLLAHYYDWQLDHPVLRGMLSIRSLLIVAYWIGVILCGLGAARQARRNDPRALIALTTPWLLMFALLPQMHERYLVWGAALTAVSIAVNVRMLLLHLLLSAASFTMMLHLLLEQDQSFAPVLSAFVAQTHPGIAWVILLIVVIHLYVTLDSSGAVGKHSSRNGSPDSSAPARGIR